MKKISLILFLCYLAFSVSASELTDNANKAYAAGDYEKAASFYEKELLKGEAFEVYYNLGNCYYKSNNIPFAILNYERAKKLKPNDPDIIFNLDLANKKIVDRVEPTSAIFIAEWKNNFLNQFSEKGWSILCIVCFFVSILLVCIYLFSGIIIVRQVSFWLSFVFLLAATSTFLCARAQFKQIVAGNEAIIISSSTDVTGSPSKTGTRLFILHEGTKVKVLETVEGWSKIELTENKIGWLPDNSFIKI